MNSPTLKRDQFRQLGVLIAVNFVDMLGFAMVLPLLPFYALKLHATPEIVGWMIASFSSINIFLEYIPLIFCVNCSITCYEN